MGSLTLWQVMVNGTPVGFPTDWASANNLEREWKLKGYPATMVPVRV